MKHTTKAAYDALVEGGPRRATLMLTLNYTDLPGYGLGGAELEGWLEGVIAKAVAEAAGHGTPMGDAIATVTEIAAEYLDGGVRA